LFFPWFALVFVSSVAMHYGLLTSAQNRPELKRPDGLPYWAPFLLIYLLHQPILLMGFYLVQIGGKIINELNN